MRSIARIAFFFPILAALPSAGISQESPQHMRIATVRGVSALGDRLLWDFHRNGKAENLVFSPLSISTAFAMLYGGARGETAAEIRNAMCFPEADEQIHTAYKELAPTLNFSGEFCQVQCANGMFPQKDYEILADYRTLLQKSYRADATELDYRGNAAGATAWINDWIAKKTSQRIRDMIPSLDPATRLVLVNAIYFKADWLHPFQGYMTHPAPFRLLSGSLCKVHMMRQEEEFPYADNSLFQAVELPYKEGRHSMVVLLPRRADGLAELEKRYVTNTLGIGLGDLKPRKVALQMPRFEIDSGTIDLIPACKRLGVRRVFDRRQAELQGVSTEPDLYVDQVLHKAWIRVNEEGTEAAAATVIGMAGCAAMPEREKPIPFRMDHPFLFFLRDRETNAVLFIGRVTQPTLVRETK